MQGNQDAKLQKHFTLVFAAAFFLYKMYKHGEKQN